MNLTTTPLSPASFADLDDAPSAKNCRGLVERASGEADDQTLKILTALLLDRALRFLREGSREEILDESLALSGGISGAAGRSLRQRAPETFGAWTALDQLLAEAGRRSDRAAVPALLRSTRGHGQAILEVLAGEGHAVARAEIRQRLSLGEAHLSHLLRDLEEADLIVRHRPAGSKEVVLDLGPVGREVVERSVLPLWLKRLTSSLLDIARGGSVDPETFARELHEAGAPPALQPIRSRRR